MEKFLSYVVDWFMNFTAYDAVALILVVFAVSLLFTALKAIVKIGGAAIGFLAVIYLIDPKIYDWCLALIKNALNSVGVTI